MTVTIADIEKAATVIADDVIRTPTVAAPGLSRVAGCDIHLKLESLQLTGSFKARGARNRLGAIDPGTTAGVIACSAGNHAQGVAYFAERMGIPATIVMPRETPFAKVTQTERYGAEVILEGDSFAEAQAHTADLAAARNLIFVPPYDDDLIIAGQGTAGLELSEDGETDKEFNGTLNERDLENALAEREQAQFDAAAEALRQAIEAVPELAQLQDSLIVEQTPEGLRIQLVDQAGYSMFALGSAQPNEQTRRLVQLVSRVVTQMDNKISISGHTDSRPYRAANGYTNWELSSDRANAARRLLIESGLGANRIALVQGRADTDPLLPTEPESEQNRRISIVLLRENAMPVEINEQNFGEGVPPQTPPPNEFGANDPDETPARRTEIADDRSPG